MPTTQNKPSKALLIAAFAALYLIWGSTYLAILYAIKTIPPFLMAGTRFLTAGLLLFAWCLAKGEKVPSLKSLGILFCSGVLMLFVGNAAVGWVEQYLPSGLVAIVVASLPLWFIALDKRQWRYHFSNKIIILGVVVGFAGVLLLVVGDGSLVDADNRMEVISFAIVLIGTVSWAIGSLITKYKKIDGTATAKAAVQMFSAGIVSILAGFISNEQKGFSLDQVTGTSIAALVYLIVMGSLVAYMSYVWLLSVRPPSLVGTYAYVNPVVAVFLGWLIADEAITQQQIIALSIILFGVVLVNLSRDKNSQKKELEQKDSIALHKPERSPACAD